MSRSDLIDVTLQVHHETDKAFLVSDDGDRTKAVWVAKSQCERGDRAPIGKGIYEFSMPEWLATEKGFV